MNEFFSISNTSEGISRKLAEGVTTNIFPGDQAMISIARFEPNAEGKIHHHPEEQWGFMVEGSETRVQGDQEIPVSKGDFWRTPSNVPHTMKAGPEGALIFDIFAPPRKDYLTPGEGFGSES